MNNNFIDLSARLFPVGKQVWHRKFRMVDILEADGNQRKIAYEDPSSKEDIQFLTAWVDVSDLVSVDWHKAAMLTMRVR